MATQVYLSGKNVIVAQSGTDTLTILEENSKYVIIQPVSSVSGIEPLTPEYIRFLDTFTGDLRTSLISDVIDGSGNSFGTLGDLQKYLDFIPRSNSVVTTKEEATAENQLTIIGQNEEIKEAIDKNTLNTDNLDNIKELQKGNNKILKKIYNPE
jgi:hypothetical protein